MNRQRIVEIGVGPDSFSWHTGFAGWQMLPDAGRSAATGATHKEPDFSGKSRTVDDQRQPGEGNTDRPAGVGQGLRNRQIIREKWRS